MEFAIKNILDDDNKIHGNILKLTDTITAKTSILNYISMTSYLL
jgi:hypothetical protein